MQLSEWMADHGMTDARMGELIGIDRTAINRLRRGLTRPSWPVMDRIKDATHGAVTADDFVRNPQPAQA